MLIYKKIVEKKKKICVVGLGYVGMPIAIEFAKHVNVIGYDTNCAKVDLYKSGIDPTNEVGNESIKTTSLIFTSDENMLDEADFFIIAVPTPVKNDNTPDLNPVESASHIVGRHIKKGAYVVYESTVYPGVTEDICVPILENESQLICGKDFKIGYSPERINPGDKVHTLTNICKIVSGMDEQSLEEIKKVYDIIIKAGTFPVSSIKVAEAIKIVENSQRDINIAFMNELAMVFDKLGIDTNEVVDGMNTKWNALGFRPGLVGGHCIGVDPYYFTYKAEILGYHSQIVASGRRVNDGMGKFVADSTVKQMILAGIDITNSKIAVLGLTFKENCPDIRNTKVIDIIQELKSYGVEPLVTDPLADKDEVKKLYGLNLCDIDDIKDADCIILAVAHNQYKLLSASKYKEMMKNNGTPVIIDIKGITNLIKNELDDVVIWKL